MKPEAVVVQAVAHVGKNGDVAKDVVVSKDVVNEEVVEEPLRVDTPVDQQEAEQATPEDSLPAVQAAEQPDAANGEDAQEEEQDGEN